MVRYSNEAKQYMGDVLWAGLLILATQNALHGAGFRRWLILFIVGALSFFFSYPALVCSCRLRDLPVSCGDIAPCIPRNIRPLVFIGVASLAFSYYRLSWFSREN